MFAWALLMLHQYVPHHHHDSCVHQHEATHHHGDLLDMHHHDMHMDSHCNLSGFYGKTIFAFLILLPFSSDAFGDPENEDIYHALYLVRSYLIPDIPINSLRGPPVLFS